jgi:peptidoglycan/LPS O-acetylase OafA/YrhL
MAMGGLFALLLHSKDAPWPRRVLPILYNPNVQLGLYLFTAYAMINGKTYDFADLGVSWSDYTVYSFLFGAIIINLAGNPQSILHLENPILHWLGNLSYGMYCYNWITSVSAVQLILLVWPGSHLHSSSLSALVEVLSLILVFVASALSYEFLERRFLLLKQRPAFSRLITMPATTLKAEG